MKINFTLLIFLITLLLFVVIDAQDPPTPPEPCPADSVIVGVQPPCQYSVYGQLKSTGGQLFTYYTDPTNTSEAIDSVNVVPGTYYVTLEPVDPPVDPPVEPVSTCSIIITEATVNPPSIPTYTPTSCVGSTVTLNNPTDGGIAYTNAILKSDSDEVVGVKNDDGSGFTFKDIPNSVYQLTVQSDVCGQQDVPAAINVNNQEIQSLLLEFLPSSCPTLSTIKVTLSNPDLDPTPKFFVNGETTSVSSPFPISKTASNNAIVYDAGATGCTAKAHIDIPNFPPSTIETLAADSSVSFVYPVTHTVSYLDACQGAKVTLAYPTATYPDVKVYYDATSNGATTPTDVPLVENTFEATYGVTYYVTSQQCSLDTTTYKIHTIVVQPPMPNINIDKRQGECSTNATITVDNYLDFKTLTLQYTFADDSVQSVEIINGLATAPISSTLQLVYQSNICQAPTTIPLGLNATLPEYVVVPTPTPVTLCSSNKGQVSFTAEGLAPVAPIDYQPSQEITVTFNTLLNDVTKDCYNYYYVWTAPESIGYTVTTTPPQCSSGSKSAIQVAGTTDIFTTLLLDKDGTNPGTAYPAGGWVDVTSGSHSITYQCAGDGNTENQIQFDIVDVSTNVEDLPFTITPKAASDCTASDMSITVAKKDPESTDTLAITFVVSGGGNIDASKTSVIDIPPTTTVTLKISYGPEASPCETTQVIEMPEFVATPPTFTIDATATCSATTTMTITSSMDGYSEVVLRNDDLSQVVESSTPATYPLVRGQTYSLSGKVAVGTNNVQCAFQTDVVVPEQLPETVTLTAPTTVGETCLGSNDGTATFTLATPYVLTATSQTYNTESTSNGVFNLLTTGTYQLTLGNIDNPFCQSTPSIPSFAIATLYTPAIVVETQVDACMAQSTGSINAVIDPESIKSDWKDITYTLDASNTSQADGAFSKLAVGSHNVTAKLNVPVCNRIISQQFEIKNANVISATTNSTAMCNTIFVDITTTDPATTYEIRVTNDTNPVVIAGTGSGKYNFTAVPSQNFTVTISTPSCDVITLPVISDVQACVPTESSDSDDDDSDDDKKMSAGTLAGIIIGVTIGCSIIGIIAYVVIKKSMATKYHHPIEMDGPKYKIMMDQ